MQNFILYVHHALGMNIAVIPTEHTLHYCVALVLRHQAPASPYSFSVCVAKQKPSKSLRRLQCGFSAHQTTLITFLHD